MASARLGLELVVEGRWPNLVQGLRKPLSKTFIVGEVGDLWFPAVPVNFSGEDFVLLVELESQDESRSSQVVGDPTSWYLLRYNRERQHSVAEPIHEDVCVDSFNGTVVPWVLLDESCLIIQNQVLERREGCWCKERNLPISGVSYLLKEPLGGFVALNSFETNTQGYLGFEMFQPNVQPSFFGLCPLGERTLVEFGRGASCDAEGRVLCVVRHSETEIQLDNGVPFFQGESWQVARVSLLDSSYEVIFPQPARSSENANQVYIRTCSFTRSRIAVIADELVASEESVFDGAWSLYILDADGELLQVFSSSEVKSSPVRNPEAIGVCNWYHTFDSNCPMVAAGNRLFCFEPHWGMMELQTSALEGNSTSICQRPHATISDGSHQDAVATQQTVHIFLRDGEVDCDADILQPIEYFAALFAFRHRCSCGYSGKTLDAGGEQETILTDLDASCTCFRALLCCLQADLDSVRPFTGLRDFLTSIGCDALSVALELVELCSMLCWPIGGKIAHREIWRLFDGRPVWEVRALSHTLLERYTKRAVSQQELRQTFRRVMPELALWMVPELAETLADLLSRVDVPS